MEQVGWRRPLQDWFRLRCHRQDQPTVRTENKFFFPQMYRWFSDLFLRHLYVYNMTKVCDRFSFANKVSLYGFLSQCVPVFTGRSVDLISCFILKFCSCYFWFPEDVTLALCLFGCLQLAELPLLCRDIYIQPVNHSYSARLSLSS